MSGFSGAHSGSPWMAEVCKQATAKEAARNGAGILQVVAMVSLPLYAFRGQSKLAAAGHCARESARYRAAGLPVCAVGTDRKSLKLRGMP